MVFLGWLGMDDVNSKFDKFILFWIAGVGSIQLFAGSLMFIGSLASESGVEFDGFVVAATSVFWFWMFRVLELLKLKG